MFLPVHLSPAGAPLVGLHPRSLSESPRKALRTQFESESTRQASKGDASPVPVAVSWRSNAPISIPESAPRVSEAKRVLNCLGIEVDDNLLENTQEEHNVKTIINEILKEHELEGELRGELRMKRELAATMLTNGETPEQIVALTNLPMDLV